MRRSTTKQFANQPRKLVPKSTGKGGGKLEECVASSESTKIVNNCRSSTQKIVSCLMEHNDWIYVTSLHNIACWLHAEDCVVLDGAQRLDAEECCVLE